MALRPRRCLRRGLSSMFLSSYLYVCKGFVGSTIEVAILKHIVLMSSMDELDGMCLS